MDVVTQPKSIGVSQFQSPRQGPRVSIELYWLPLGAGGRFVRLNGRIYEALHALVERRRPLDLYHSALEVRGPEGRFIIENCWPIPDQESAARGVVVEGPVGSRRMARWRVFRYEVRRWRDGTIADADEAVASPQPLSDDLLVAGRLLIRHVELQLAHLLAARPQWAPNGHNHSASRLTRPRMGGGSNHGPPPALQRRVAGHGPDKDGQCVPASAAISGRQ